MYDTLGKMHYANYLLLDASVKTEGKDYPVLVSNTKIFDPPVSADSIYLYDPEKDWWRSKLKK